MGYASSADRSRGRRGPAWLPLAVTAVVVPTALAGLSLLWPGPQIQTDLGRSATEALSAAGLTGAGVTFDGRDATITGVSGPDADRAVGIVEGVTGVRVAQFATDGSPSVGDGSVTTGEPAAPAPAAPFAVARRGEDVVLTGVVDSEEERAALVEAATAQAGGRTVVDELTVTPGATAAVDAAGVGSLAALVAGAGDGVSAELDGDTLTLTGTAADDAAVQAAADAASAALPGITVDNQLVAGGGAPTDGAGELDAAAKQELQSAIDALVAGAPITFEPDSATLTPAGSATVSGVLDLLRPVPAARLQVDGFVATGPGSGQLSAQELSDQRAATVRDALVAGGVAADNVAASGRGEGDAPAAEAAGRRVDITVV